ncbi:pyridoxal phosphate-dependent aminotransferase (plasmid) [Alkalihalophilus sp. As8PL]|uniref:Pyridoxal phosphate-dependent aminotransferase n=1 Tax=Alkalihalophilus sp. As8PL TaxID=3237103 RepID=A0AB39BMU1_9BACI
MDKLKDNLRRARNVLSGEDENGKGNHPGQFDDGVISFADGEGMRRPHPSVLGAAIKGFFETEVTSLEKYFFKKKHVELENAISNDFKKQGIYRENTKNLCISSGTSNLFNSFFYSVSEPGDTFLTTPGFYHSLVNWCVINKIDLDILPFDSSNNCKISKAQIENWVVENPHKKLRGLILFNPTYFGAVYTAKELEELSRYVQEKELVVIEDSIFSKTIFEGEIVHLSSFQSSCNNVVTVDGGSKAFGLANLRIGWACGPEKIIERMNFHVQATQVNVPHIIKEMALAALNAPSVYLKTNNIELKRRKDYLISSIEEINKSLEEKFSIVSPINVLHSPQSGHSILISLDKLKPKLIERNIYDSIDLTRYFLEECKVAFSPGLSMGFDGYKLRISYGCLGLENTYETSLRYEKMNMVNDLVKMKVIEFPEKDLSLKDLEREISNDFLKSNSIISEGLIERVLPSLISLCNTKELLPS